MMYGFIRSLKMTNQKFLELAKQAGISVERLEVKTGAVTGARYLAFAIDDIDLPTYWKFSEIVKEDGFPSPRMIYTSSWKGVESLAKTTW